MVLGSLILHAQRYAHIEIPVLQVNSSRSVYYQSGNQTVFKFFQKLLKYSAFLQIRQSVLLPD